MLPFGFSAEEPSHAGDDNVDDEENFYEDGEVEEEVEEEATNAGVC
jgi:hypothetical protein